MLRTAAALLILAGLAGSAQAAGPSPVPEISPGSMTGAIALLAGGLLLLTDHFRRR
jgi:hypothetical protein